MSDPAPAPPGPPPADSGATIAYDKVAQTASLIVQDAADYQRNTLAVCSAAQGKALARMLANPAEIEQLMLVLMSATLASAAVGATAALISEQAATLLKNFPRD